MPILLQLAQSYSNPDSVNYKVAYLRELMEQKVLNLGDLAYEDQVQLAMLGETVIVGGYLRTELIAANSITADKINVDSLSAISADLGEVTSGSLNIGNGAFKVSSAGKLEATGADITGKITATSGTIGGWNITGGYIDTRDGSARMYLASHADSASYYIHVSDSLGNRMFSVSKTGVLYARNADISGNITATSGSFPANLITGALTANQINVSTLSAISANLGTVTAGILKSSNGQSYFDLNNNKIKTNNAEITGGTININTISELSNIIQLNGRGHTLYLAPGLIEMSFGSNQKTQIGPGNVLIGDILLSFDEILFLSNSQLTPTDIGAHYITTYTLTTDALHVTGSKNRIIKTKNFDRVLHYCLESPTPYFMDIGHGVIGYDGICYIDIEQIFSETVDLISDYHVMLTKYGPGDIWVADKQPTHFVVEGTPGLRFAWEIKAKQKGYSNERLEKYERLEYEEEVDYGTLGYEYTIEYEKELIV